MLSDTSSLSDEVVVLCCSEDDVRSVVEVSKGGLSSFSVDSSFSVLVFFMEDACPLVGSVRETYISQSCYCT